MKHPHCITFSLRAIEPRILGSTLRHRNSIQRRILLGTRHFPEPEDTQLRCSQNNQDFKAPAPPLRPSSLQVEIIPRQTSRSRLSESFHAEEFPSNAPAFKISGGENKPHHLLFSTLPPRLCVLTDLGSTGAASVKRKKKQLFQPPKPCLNSVRQRSFDSRRWQLSKHNPRVYFRDFLTNNYLTVFLASLCT